MKIKFSFVFVVIASLLLGGCSAKAEEKLCTSEFQSPTAVLFNDSDNSIIQTINCTSEGLKIECPRVVVEYQENTSWMIIGQWVSHPCFYST